MVKLLISAGLYVRHAMDDQPTVLNVYTDGSAYNTMAKTSTVFTAGPYARPAVKTSITVGKCPFWDHSDYELSMISIRVVCHITDSESPGGD